MDDAYGPVTCPSQLHDETLDKMLKNRDNIRIYLVTMPQSVSIADLPNSIELDTTGIPTPKLGGAGNSPFCIAGSAPEVVEKLIRSHCLWTVVQSSAAPAPGKAVRISKDPRRFDGVWEVRYHQ
ncbi:hypothetical protein MDAP_002789 [Mitosporidium daphniae]